MKNFLPILLLSLSSASCVAAVMPEKETVPKNIIMVIGDGMGPAYTTAYRYFSDNPNTEMIEETVFDRHLKGFSSKDFAKFHPGGSLGKKLYLRVSDLTKLNKQPAVQLDTDIKKVIIEISESLLGLTVVVEDSKVVGIITDGDLRRMLTKADSFHGLTAKDIMSKNPKTISNNAMAVEVIDIMDTNGITQIIAVEDGKYCGIVHIHNLTNEGII